MPTFDLTFNQLCPITHHSLKTKTFLMVLLSSPAVITTRTAFCNTTRAATRFGGGGPTVSGLGQPAETQFPTFALLYNLAAARWRVSYQLLKWSTTTRGVKESKCNQRQKKDEIQNSLVTN